MPAKAGNETTTKRSGSSPALRKAKDEITKLRSRYSGKMKEYREQRVPGALINSTGTMLGGLPVGVVAGLVPETWTVMDTEVPTGVLYEILASVGGVVVAGGSAALGMEYGIHMGAGMTTVAGAMLTKRGTRYGKEKALAAWNSSGTPNGTAQAPYVVNG